MNQALLDDADRIVAADLYPARCRRVVANLAATLREQSSDLAESRQYALALEEELRARAERMDQLLLLANSMDADFETYTKAHPVAAPDLTDPVVVHANMLRGTIAKPTVEQIIHLYGREAFQPMIDAAVAKALEEACLAVSEHADWPEDAHGRTEQVGLFARVINAIRAITPAVTQPALEPVAPPDPVHRPTMTEMMVDPDTLDAFMEANPLPPDPAAIREAALREAAALIRPSLEPSGNGIVVAALHREADAILALIQK